MSLEDKIETLTIAVSALTTVMMTRDGITKPVTLKITEAKPGEQLEPIYHIDGEELPPGNIEWDNLDVMDCPYHSGMMSSSYKKATTGAMKGCWNKMRGVEYTTEQYTLDRRVLIAKAVVRTDDDAAAEQTAAMEAANVLIKENVKSRLTGVTQDNPDNRLPPQSRKPGVPQTPLQQAAVELNDPELNFTQVCQLHSEIHGSDQLSHLLQKCGLPGDYDFTTMESDRELAEVVKYVRDNLVEHDVSA